MSEIEVPSTEDLCNLSIPRVRQKLSRVTHSLCPSAMSRLELNLQRAYRKACYCGDLERVRLFLLTLPNDLSAISERLLTDRHALSWAAYGEQCDVINFICSLQSDADFVSFDYGLVLALLTHLAERSGSDGFSISSLIRESEGISCSSLVAILDVVVKQDCIKPIQALEGRLESVLDRQIACQMAKSSRRFCARN